MLIVINAHLSTVVSLRPQMIQLSILELNPFWLHLDLSPVSCQT